MTITALVRLAGALAVLASGPALAEQSKTLTGTTQSGKPCTVVQQQSSNADGSMSSSVQAGGGTVTGSTSGPGQSVTVQSGNGQASSSVATSSSSNGSTIVASTGSGENCIVTIKPGQK
jgi:hypothetical protein